MTKNIAIALEVQTRECTGTADSRRLRRAGRIPVVMYSHGKEGVNLTADLKQATSLVYVDGKVTVKNTTTGTTHQAIVKDVAISALTLEIMHIDLKEI